MNTQTSHAFLSDTQLVDKVHKILGALAMIRSHLTLVSPVSPLGSKLEVLIGRISSIEIADSKGLRDGLIEARGILFIIMGMKDLSQDALDAYLRFTDPLIESLATRTHAPVHAEVSEGRGVMAQSLTKDFITKLKDQESFFSDTPHTYIQTHATSLVSDTATSCDTVETQNSVPISVIREEVVREVVAPKVIVPKKIMTQAPVKVAIASVTPKTPPEVKSSAPVTHTFHSNERSQKILSMLSSKGKLGIKDISSALENVSEKTVQRELISLIVARKIRREGDRRWALYALA
jgi:DNA-binding transcriptional ArsR family regulator